MRGSPRKHSLLQLEDLEARIVPVIVVVGASKDNTLYQSATGAESNGAGEGFFVGTNNTNSIRRGVIAFDVAGNVPAGAIINSATLRLNMSRTVAGDQSIQLRRLLANWGEGTSNAGGQEGGGAPSTTNDATWVHRFFSSSTWTNQGGDFTTTVTATTTVGGNGAYTWGSTTQMVNDVKSWLDTPTGNFGWILVGNETAATTAKRFDTKENATAANRPMLTIDYTPAGNVPPAITSAANATFTVGSAGTFTITATGTPTPTLNLSGGLPSGVSFTPNANGTATLSGTPAAGTGGVYNLVVTASNGVGTNATQNFTLTVNQAPAITSAANTTFTVGTAGTFTITSTGFPNATLSQTGTLPTGVTFTPNANGTATLSGTPAAGTGGVYNLVITASNGVGTNATQNFTLTVNQAPAITSAANTTFTVGTAGTFTFTSTGTPTPNFSLSGSLPTGVTFTPNANGTATLAGTPAAGTAGTYNLVLTAGNGIGTNATQNFTLTVAAANQPPAITSAANTTFTVGSAGTFTITSTGTPTPGLTLTGTLPTGVTFTPNANGTATLAGTPAAGTGGVYNLVLTASNGVGNNATQNFTLTVNQAPAITSGANTTFTVGTAGTFTITSTGFPNATLSQTGALPSGVTFTANANGTATLAGTPAAGTGGTYNLVITANNGVGANATQNFTLTVNQSPAITSAANTTFTVGAAGTFTITSTGFPNATLSQSGALPTGVTFTANSNGTATLAGTPAAGTGGVYNLVITASNGVGVNATQNFTLTVNQAPAITSAANTTFVVGAAGTFTITSTGFPNATLSQTGALPTGVTFTANANGTATLAGNPAAGTGGTYNLVITASNGVGANATQNFTLTVNQAPTITSAANTTFAVGTAGTFTITTTGFPTATLSQTGALPSGVTFTANANGTATLAGTPAAGTAGTYNLVLTASNGVGANATQNFTLTVTATNQPPVLAAIGNRTGNELTQLAFTATATDPDVPAQALTFSLVGAPAGAAINPTTGAFTFTPTEAQGPGVFTFTVRVTDNGSPNLSDEETITVTVNEVNVAPVLAPIGNRIVNELQQLTFTATATDADLPANALTFSLINAPTGAAINPTTGVFTFTPTEAQGPGSFTFTVRVTDNGSPTFFAEETITVTVNEVNRSPVLAAIGNRTVNELTQLAFTATATDPDLPANALTFSLIGAPAGAAINATTGAFTFTPTEAQGPGSFTFTVRVTDNGTPNLVAEETITVTVNEVNVAPVLAPIGNRTVNEETLLTFTATATDADLPANALTFSLIGAPTGAAINPTTGVFTFTPTEAQGPGSFTFTVRVTDNGTPNLFAEETITVTVTEVNRPPVLAPIGNRSVTAGTLLTFTATATDPDLPANALTFTLVNPPPGASINPTTGVFAWTPALTQVGTFPTTVRVTDNGSPSLFAEETITITVTASTTNNPPVLAAIGNRTVNELQLLTFTATATDPDFPAQALTFSLINAPAGAAINASTGVFTFTPTEAQGPGTFTFTVRVTDNGTPNLFDEETITVTVTEVNLPPVLSPIGNRTVNELQLLAFTATATDPDLPANAFTFSLIGAPTGATINAGTGAFSFTPTEAQGSGSFTFTVRVTDNGSPNLFAEETITVTVIEVNRPPVLAPIGNRAVTAGTLLTFTATATDPDLPANTLTFTLVNPPAGASINPTTGAFTWTPALTQVGTFPTTVRVTDNGTPNLFAEETITITVTASTTNNPPVLAAIGNRTGNELQLLAFTATATDPDVPAQALTFSLVGAPAGAAINPTTGVFTFTPTEAQGPGTFTFTVRVTDNGTPNLFDEEAITVTVTEVNAPPILAAIGNRTVTVGNTLAFTATATDPDLPANPLTFSLLGAPAGASINPATGAFSFTPTAAQANMVFSFTVRVTDNGSPNLFDDEAISVTVNPAQPPPGGLVPDPLDPNDTALPILGTDGDDVILVFVSANPTQLTISINGVSAQAPRPTGHVVIDALGGNDVVILTALPVRGILNGGPGSDVLFGGLLNDVLLGGSGNDVGFGAGGNDVFVGGEGEDVSFGQGGTDVLIGGFGADALFGDDGGDLLLGGTTAFDANLAALNAIRNEWSSGRSYEDRVANLRGTGTGPRLNDNFFLKTGGIDATVFNDGVANALFGAGDRDWFFASLIDLLVDREGDELIDRP